MINFSTLPYTPYLQALAAIPYSERTEEQNLILDYRLSNSVEALEDRIISAENNLEATKKEIQVLRQQIENRIKQLEETYNFIKKDSNVSDKALQNALENLNNEKSKLVYYDESFKFSNPQIEKNKETLNKINELIKTDRFCNIHNLKYNYNQSYNFRDNQKIETHYLFECSLCLEELKYRQKKEKWIEIMKECELLTEFQNLRLEEIKPFSPTDDKQLKAIKSGFDFLNNDSIYTLLFLGNVGRGKTYIANAIIGSWIWQHLDEVEKILIESKKNKKSYSLNMIYSKESSMCNRYREINDNDFNKTISRSDLIAMYSNIPLLVIDEIGRADSKPSELKFLSDVISNRVENHKKTIYISNHMDLAKYFDTHIISRLGLNSKMVKFNDKIDYRIKRKVQENNLQYDLFSENQTKSDNN